MIYFFICTRPFDQFIGSSFIYYFFSTRPFESSLIYIFHLRTNIRQKYMIFFLSFIHSLCTTIRPKNRVLINLLFLFVHDHSTKLGVTLTILFILFLDVPIFPLLYSWEILPLHLIGYVHSSTIFTGELFLHFVRYIHGYMKSYPLPFLYTFTGCDIVSSFYGKGKFKAGTHGWAVNTKILSYTDLFSRLGNKPEPVSDNDLDIIERFVV